MYPDKIASLYNGYRKVPKLCHDGMGMAYVFGGPF
jgi:hypothetical protein